MRSAWKLAAAAAAVAVLRAETAQAADQPLYQPPAEWVRPTPIPFSAPPSGAAADLLLWDTQARLTPESDDSYVDLAIRINTPEGLSGAGNLIRAWNPLTDTLVIHRVQIIRGGKTIDVLAGGRKFAVLRRETNLEAAMIDGQLTATLQPEGLQVGDVLDFAFTLRRHDPALGSHSDGALILAHAGSVGRMAFRARWPAGDPIRWWKTDDLPALTPETKDGWTEVAFDEKQATSPDPPAGAPLRAQLRGVLQFGDYKDWPALSAAAYPLFAKAATLAPNSPLNAEIARLKAANADPKARALAALQLVENQVRYFYVGLDAGGYTPAAADLTWTRRFGDCKGKTALLLALLNGLGVKAEAALASTQAGDGLDQRLPQMGDFDHVLVRAEIGGRVYWLDGTRMDDANLDVLPIPNFHWALPLRPEGAALEPLRPPPPPLPLTEKTVRVDARGGFAKPVPVHVELTLRDDVALATELALKQASAADADRALRQVVEGDDSWITGDKVVYTYAPKAAVLHATLDGSGSPPFDSNQEWRIDDSSIGFDADFKRETPYHRDAPYAVAYPQFTRTTVEVQLPDQGRGFSLLNDAAVDQTTGGVAYKRSAVIANGRMSVTASSRALVQEFPAAEAPATQAALHDLSAYTVVLQASGLGAPAAVVGKDVEALEQAAEADIKARDYAGAVDALTKAIAKGSPTAKLYDQRATARIELKEDELARADLEAAVKLNPRDVVALLALGRLALDKGDLPTAQVRYEAALQAAPAPLATASAIANLFEIKDRHAEALPFYDRALMIDASGTERAELLNGRCWSRAELGRELQAALDDCNESLALRPDADETLDSRGLVELRLGAYDKAIADYTAALKLNAKLPTSLFGRGVAELRAGRKTAGAADIAAARAMDAKVEQQFAGFGVKP